jgi:hypothetical protein
MFRNATEQEKEMSDKMTFCTFSRYTEIPVDQMTPALEGIGEEKGETLATKVRRIVTGQASGQTMQPMPGGGPR